MNEEIKAVADRLIGLREIMDVSVEEAAAVCRIAGNVEVNYVEVPQDVHLSNNQNM